MPTRIASAVVALLLSAVGGGVPTSQPASRPADQAGGASPPTTAGACPEWETFSRSYEAAVAYFRQHGSWTKPATAEQDKKIAGELGKALWELRAAVLRGDMRWDEWEFVRNEVTYIDFLGGRSYRNTVLPNGGVRHADYFPVGRGAVAYKYLRDQVPLLRDFSLTKALSPWIRGWVLDRVRERIQVLADRREAGAADLEARITRRLAKDPNSVAPMDVGLLRTEALSLLAQIGGKEKPAQTR